MPVMEFSYLKHLTMSHIDRLKCRASPIMKSILQKAMFFQGAWSECDAPCGGGTRTREVFCSEEESFQRVSDGLCDSNLMPAVNESCNTEPCRPR